MSIARNSQYWYSGTIGSYSIKDRVKTFGVSGTFTSFGATALGGTSAKSESKASFFGLSSTNFDSATGLSHGAGVEGAVSDPFTIGAGLHRAWNDVDISGDDVTIDVISGQVRRRF